MILNCSNVISTCIYQNWIQDLLIQDQEPRPRLESQRPRPSGFKTETETRTLMSKTKTETQDLQDQGRAWAYSRTADTRQPHLGWTVTNKIINKQKICSRIYFSHHSTAQQLTSYHVQQQFYFSSSH